MPISPNKISENILFYSTPFDRYLNTSAKRSMDRYQFTLFIDDGNGVNHLFQG